MHQILSYILCVSAFLIGTFFFVLYELAYVFKARINLYSNPNCNLRRRTGKILFGGGGLNIICPNETCWSQMHNDSFVK